MKEVNPSTIARVDNYEVLRDCLGSGTYVSQSLRRLVQGSLGRMEGKTHVHTHTHLDITSADDVPDDLAGLSKYFEPSFEAMLVEQTGNDDEGKPKEDWNMQGSGFVKTAVEARFVCNQANGHLGGEGIRLHHKEVHDLNTIQP